MKGSFKALQQDKIISFGILFTTLLLISTLIVVFLYLNSLPPYIPIFNQLPWGEDRLGPTISIFIPLGIALIFGVANLIISYFIYSRSQIISRILTITTVLIAFLSFLFILRTVHLIT